MSTADHSYLAMRLGPRHDVVVLRRGHVFERSFSEGCPRGNTASPREPDLNPLSIPTPVFRFSLAAAELLASAQRQSVSASISGPNAAYNSSRVGKVNRRFLDNTVIQAIGDNIRQERKRKRKQ